jgi:hypothetical protein
VVAGDSPANSRGLRAKSKAKSKATAAGEGARPTQQQLLVHLVELDVFAVLLDGGDDIEGQGECAAAVFE